MGASTAVRHAAAISTHITCEGVTVPAIVPRTAVTRCETGLRLTHDWSHEGIVDGSTKMLLANVSGMSTIIEVPITAFGVRMTRPRMVKAQLSANAKTTSR